ncbi:cytochrome oxidase assembly protein ShyY1 [Microbacteriaceae bacterium SG_E_30_P1]|uniref:SURF1-like protein n=1 Tax=Antiquaquibacter oligotrophicus TaxID=2880260 RepID=A0ABT6KMC3_9MICO|nr:SURF1 family protein [Antiquaquibacter oligotrophicus]MDH6180911.1 cytochrome oxidase assembly protein ShyY1 [Antiquaquibacter oligotrophicus]UDF13384.1 SURF1 family protein [Antiquaquibacter oligotrophicus]
MSTGWRFALSRRWLGYLALVVAFAIACVLLSQWQLARRDEARAAMDLVENNWDSAPVPLDDALPTLESFDADDQWIPVRVEGRYLDDEQVLVRGRPMNGAPGFAVLVPLLLDDGSVLVIDRGWVPTGNEQDAPDAVPAPPGDRVSVIARLKAGEPTLPGRSAPAGQLASINLPQVQELVDRPTYVGAYGVLAEEDPAPPVRPAALTRPELDEGPHLSYAFQWLVFGILAFVALGWAVRQEYRARNEDDPAEQARAEKRRAKAAKKQPSDADVEDALLDN